MLCGTRRTARAGARSVASLQRCSRFNIIARRCFASHTEDDGGLINAATREGGEVQHGDAHRNGVFMGLVESRTPQTTTIEELLSKIQPRPVGRAMQRNNTNSLLTVFLTPAFAQHALDSKFPLNVMQRFTEQRVVSKPLDAVVAVVDRLPTPNGETAGAEGLAYAFVSNPVNALDVSKAPLQMTAQKPGSLSFNLPPASDSSNPAIAQVPLAQTIFSNGLPSTLVHTHYDFDATTGSLHECSSRRLESQTLSIPFENASAHMVYETPFTPLTPVRQIMSSMGNIIRKLSPHSFTQEQHLSLDPSYAPEPSSFLSASEELEKAVSDYFKLLEAAPATVHVWALILPDRAREAVKSAMDLPGTLLDIDRQVLEALWIDPNWQGQWKMRQLDVLQRGCRLARVLSGGGGWGKKAGLLSLDPDTSYSTRDLRSDEGWQFTFADEYTDETVADQQRSALGEIIKPGEHVMFFLAPRKANSPSLEDVRYMAGSDRAMTLGVLPSSIDELPEDLTHERASQENASLAVHHYHDAFGMLSEGGMALTMTTEHNGETQTKIDVPFSNLTISGGQTKGNGLGKYLQGLSGNPSMGAKQKAVPTMKQQSAKSKTSR